MAFNISEFSSNIGRYGVLQTNKFMVFFVPPISTSISTFTNVGDILNTFNTLRIIQLRAEQARLPGVAIRSSDVARYGTGVTQKMPFNAQFTDTSITFVNDAESDIRRYFYSWMNNVIDFNGSTNFRGTPTYTLGYKDDYVTDIFILTYDNYGNIADIVTLKDAFPVSMNDISMDWGNTNSVMKITVGFAFREWSMNNVNSAIAGTIDTVFGALSMFSGAENAPSNAVYTQDPAASSFDSNAGNSSYDPNSGFASPSARA